MRVLVVEDEKKMAQFLRKALSEAGYSVDLAETASAAEALVVEVEYDLVILDVMLPDLNGIDTARHLRQDGYRGPLLILTALASTKDKIRGLDAGADDYLSKPFALDELLARVRALLRRNDKSIESTLKFCDLELDLLKRNCTRAGKDLTLTAKEFALLEFFMRNPNRPLSRGLIAEHVWDVSFDSESNVIDVYINMLRKKIDHPFDKKLLHTIVGAGYVLRES